MGEFLSYNAELLYAEVNILWKCMGFLQYIHMVYIDGLVQERCNSNALALTHRYAYRLSGIIMVWDIFDNIGYGIGLLPIWRQAIIQINADSWLNHEQTSVKFNCNITIFSQDNEVDSIVCKMAANLSSIILTKKW